MYYLNVEILFVSQVSRAGSRSSSYEDKNSGVEEINSVTNVALESNSSPSLARCFRARRRELKVN